MASGKLSARQKMINLMYLIFIAMLALNISKEVLQAFGLMNERLEANNESATLQNESFLASLDAKVGEQPAKFTPLKEKATEINNLAEDFVNYLEELKTGSYEDVERLDNGQLDATQMDKGDYLDELLFIGDKLKPEGEAFVNKMKAFRNGVVNILGTEEKFKGIVQAVERKFNTDDVKNKDGGTQDYMHYHYFGFPLISSVTKMTGLQNDVKTTQSEVLSAMLGNQLTADASLTNYKAIVIPEKTAFFSGENFKGKIVLGRFDSTLQFDKVEINGNEVTNVEAGQVQLDFPSGNVGTKDITGKLFYTSSEYAVINRPNSATISADKMNVVYQGVVNPMTISFAGVADNNVNASAAGLTRKSGSSYEMRPGKGREVTINVNGKLPDGSPVSDSQTFRIKQIPRPVGTVRNDDTGFLKMSKEALSNSPIGAALPDFDFDLNLKVNKFKIKVEGAGSIEVQGGRLNAQAKKAVQRAKRGSQVQIFDINASIAGNSGYKLRKVSSVIIELTN